tara:strand:- start:1333 stop:4170 length:2838 start_codon:yes stop_codon:yes gene_type:complete
MPSDPFSNTDIITPEMEAAANAMGFNILANVGKDIEEGTEPETGFETPGFVGGSVIGGGTAYDPGDGTNTDSAKSWDLEFESDAGLAQVVDSCGDFIATVASEESAAGGYDEFTNAHFIVCVNEELSDSLTKGDIGALTGFKAINSPGDYVEEIRPITNIGPTVKDPYGNKKQTCNLTFTTPEGSTYASVHSFTCVDLAAVNRAYGTDFPAQKRVLDHSHDVLMVRGKTLRKASAGDKDISNIKIKDYGELNRVANVDTSLSPVPSDQVSNPLMEFGISKDINGDANFVFDIDVVSALKSTSFGSIFLKSLSPSVKNDILANVKITSMEVIRKRIDGVNEGKEEVIARSSQKNGASLLKENTLKLRERNDIEGITMGAISELNMRGSYNIRTFSGVDHSLPAAGKYKYTVKFSMSDAIASYLRSRLTSLEVSCRQAKIWQQEISSPEYSENTRQSFSYTGARAIRRKYIDATTPIEKSLATYAEIVGDIFGADSSKNIIDIAYPMVNSITGGTRGAQAVVDAMEYLKYKLYDLLEGSTSNASFEKKSSSNAGQKGTIEFEKTFDESLDMSGGTGTGYSYIGGDIRSTGVKVVSTAAYKERVDFELHSFSDSEKVLPQTTFEGLNISKSKISSLTKLATTKNSYLTPVLVSVEGEVSDISSGENRFNKTLVTSAVKKLRSHNDKSKGFSMDSLSSIGITCENINGKKRKGGTFQADSKKAGSIFSEDDTFVSDGTGELDSCDQETTLPGTINEITKLISSLLAPNNTESKQGEMKLNVFDVTKRSTIQKSNISSLSSLPLQLKSVFLSRSPDIKNNFLDSSNESVYDINCNSIVVIETLSYEEDSIGNSFPKWNILTASRLTQAENRSFRCRMVRYTNSSLGIDQKINLESNVFDSQFVIGGEGISKARRFSMNSSSKRLDKYMSDQNKVIRNEIKKVSGINIKGR